MSTGDVPASAPSIDLVRRTTDVLVLDDLLDHGPSTRPEIARRTGVSKPTIGQSMLRLAALGLVAEDGRATGGRGRSSVRYRLTDRIGVGLAVHAGPREIVAQCLTPAGELVAEAAVPVGVTIGGAALAEGLGEAVRRVRAASPAPVRATVVSVADPVTRDGRTVALEGSPFALEQVDVRAVLGGQTVVGNDVNWAALAELTDDVARDDGGFLYCYLGAGIGAAVVEAGQVMLGSTGLAGELAYLTTCGPGGRAMRLLDCLEELGLTVPGTTVIDVDAVRGALRDPAAGAALVRAVGVSLGSAAALLGTDLIVVGGPWGDVPGLLERLAAEAERAAPYGLVLRPARHTHRAALAGARIAAVAAARAALHDALP